MPPKRRIHVAFESDDTSHGDQKRQRKFIVSIDADATVEQLATEISTHLDQAGDTLLLQLDGFELLRKDSIDIIRDGELVMATSKDTTVPLSITKPRPMLDKSHIAHPDEPTRMQVQIVTAELARNFAKENPKQQVEPTNGILAFEGELISGNVTFGVLQDEVARVCGWDVSTDLDDHTCNHEKEGACSCAVAQEIEQIGLFSTLHCRLTIDGTPCMNDDCPYSHAELQVPYAETAPHCIVCNDALGFPCPKCLNSVNTFQTDLSTVVYCPLVQNAGCLHLHHAHCLGVRNENSAAGCPAGCQPDKFPRENAVFDFPKRHITIVWDGDKIHQISVPSTSPEGSVVQLKTTEVISLVESFLESSNFITPGQSLRIHSRDPATEIVRFVQSTLVSVCPVSAHTNQSHRRFDLFPQKASAQFIGPKGEYEVDLHTSLSPIVACRCTPLKDLFTKSDDSFADKLPIQVLLYAVKRKNEMLTGSQASRPITKSKEDTYLADSAWQPSVLQTPRGMAALLSSLYLLVYSAQQKGSAGEANILAFLYTITKFPPAVRALAILFRNCIPLAQERAALSEALYHAEIEFVLRAPMPIARNSSRFFEAIRILLAHILSAADAPSTSGSAMPPAIEEIPLVCSVSQKILTDPLLMDSTVVDRSLASLHQPGGLLYRPSTTQHLPRIGELEVKSLAVLKQLLSHCRSLPSKSILALHIERIGPAPPSHPYALDSVARDFLITIRLANKTDLVTRGPLELKSPSVVAPQIVLDEDGFLAVFTGRGCGSIRDVMFFRPVNEGDTEVDVNDVAHSLDKLIPARQAEDTWQLDSFSGDSILSNRPPDEAIVLCLDLSESMNQVSVVSDLRIPVLKQNLFDYEAESLKAVEEIVKDVSKEEILAKAKAYLEKQHFSCHHAWKTFVEDEGTTDNNSGFSGMSSGDEHSIADLLTDLGTLARRDVLKLSMDGVQSFYKKGLMNERAFFAAATIHQRDTLAAFLQDFLDSFVLSDVVGNEPYDVPRNLLDPKTGNLLTEPVCPENAPDNKTYFVNLDSCDWFEGKDVWPSGPFEPSLMIVEEIEEAVDEWIEGVDLRPRMKPKTVEGLDGDDLIITLAHAGFGDGITWNLSTATTTRTLYALVHRATRAKYSYFTVRLSSTKATITDSATLTLGLTDLVHGGGIEISRTANHTRGSSEVNIESCLGDESTILLLPGASTLSVISYIHASHIHNMCKIQLWHGLKTVGDGMRHGTIVNSYSTLRDFSSWDNSAPLSFECDRWGWRSSGAQKQREDSRHLTRLHLLKELFNIFLNRASSFDTSISLALGLVTFSDKARVDQEITPIFEDFRQQLDHVSASGDTAVYDALDTARAMLCNYRQDIPNLRKRIIIVSDGVDTCSKSPASEVCLALQKSGIIVDSVQVGKESDGTLHAISVATGGYRFSPNTSLSDALSIFLISQALVYFFYQCFYQDLETMLSSAERTAPPTIPLVLSHTQLLRYGSKWSYPVDIVTVDQFPPRARHAKLQARVRPVSFLLGGGVDNDDHTKRIMRELRTLMADPHPQIDLYVNEGDTSFFKIVLEAPKDGSPYKGGTFLLTCDLPKGYPRDPPEIRFVTFILHPNVSKQGKVCIAELGRLWTSDITLKEIFSLTYGLLLEPDLDNPLEIQASLKYYDDDGTYALAVANAVTKHASKTRQEWQLELSE